MRDKRFFFSIPLIVLTAMFLAPSIGFSVQPADSVDVQLEKEQAMAMVNRMTGFLAQVKSFSVTVDMGFDAVQDSGQKIEFGETREIVLERPDRLRVDAIKRSGEKSQLTFDGKNLSLYYEEPNVYSSEPKAGTLDEVLKYFTEDLGLRLPLAEMLSSQLAESLEGKVREAYFVEESSIEGIACDHVALRGDDVDMQVWIAKGEKPLPQRIVITYNDQEGEPQFWAQLSDWDLAPEVSEGLFVFNAPIDSKKIAFSPKQMISIEKTDVMEEKKP